MYHYISIVIRVEFICDQKYAVYFPIEITYIIKINCKSE